MKNFSIGELSRQFPLRDNAQALQKYYADGYSITCLSKQFNLNWKTVKRYLKMTDPPDTSRQKRFKPLNAYHEQIIEWESAEGISFRLFMKNFRRMTILVLMVGQSLHCSTPEEKRTDTQLDTEYYSRRDIRRILCQNHLVDDAERDIINRILEQCPIMQPVYAFIAGFHQTIAREDPAGFIELILYLTKPFIRRLLSDFKATVNAITYTENNGFVEGNVNRLKTLKIMVYDRAGYELLRQRMLYRTA